MKQQAQLRAEPRAQHREPEATQGAASAPAQTHPGVVALQKLSEMMNGSPQMAAQRALAETMNCGGAAAMPIQRVISFEYDANGRELEENWTLTVNEVMRELVRGFGFDDDYEVREVLADFNERNAIFSDFPELAQVLQDRLGAETETDNEADVGLGETASFYHGTDLNTARLLARGAKIDARGRGEFGGGFYMTHDQHQAAHIADYYTSKERRGPRWGVVRFDIPTAALQGPLKNRMVVTRDDFEDYYQSVKAEGNRRQSRYDWTIGPIKDNQTPYIQHLFASGGLAALNGGHTTRELVMSGDVGTDAAKYAAQVQNYDPEVDGILAALTEMEPEPDDEAVNGSDTDDVDYDLLEQRVTAAKSANKKKLTENVIAELEEVLESAPADDRILAWLAELRG